jgi:GNAT superfamily N-acetyltransferase
MDDAVLRERLWAGFARLQTLLGGQSAGSAVVERDGLVASVVPVAPDSPTLNAAVVLAGKVQLDAIEELRHRYADAGIRRWGVWVDAGARQAVRTLGTAGLRLSSASPGMGAVIDELPLGSEAMAQPTNLSTVGVVNDLAYGNPDGRLERTLAPMPDGILRAYRADLDGSPASVAMALEENGDCGVSFVATAPYARRRGLATQVMHRLLLDARQRGCTTTSLQATDSGKRLYDALGYRRLGDMQLWEHRA